MAANNVYERSFTGNKAVLLAENMKNEVLGQSFWGQFAQFNTPDAMPVQPGNRPAPIQSPVVIQNELTKKMGDIIEIPLMRGFFRRPRINKEQLKEHEGKAKINHVTIPVALWRNAMLPYDGSEMKQTTKDYKLEEKIKPALLNNYGLTHEFLGCGWAMYYGFSYNLIKGTRFSGHTKVFANSHPHIYVRGSSASMKVPWESGAYPGDSDYETAVATAINACGATDVFDTTFLRQLKSRQQVRKLVPLIMKDGNRYKFLVGHPYQIAGLEADPTFNAQAATVWAQNYAKENPMLTGVRYVWGGFMIFESESACWPVRVTSSAPEYGPTASDLDDDDEFFNKFTEYESDTKFAGFVFGMNALFKAHASKIEWRYRTDDYDEIAGVAWKSIEGYARGDYWNEDDGTRGEHLVNDGSVMFITAASMPADVA